MDRPTAASASGAGFNLVMSYRHKALDPGDYAKIAERIGKLASDVHVHILPDLPQPSSKLRSLAERPTLVFCPTRLRLFKVLRGATYCGQRVPKDEQLRMLAAQGIRVPKWTFLKPQTTLSEQEWGRFTILKPAAFGSATLGRGVELVRTSAIRYRLPAQFSKDHPGGRGQTIVQQFIDTGKHLEDYRVLTLFGAPLYALRRRQLTPLPDLDDPTWMTATAGVTTNAISGEREAEYCYDQDVLKFASKIYLAMPQVPLQGCDIRREAKTGRLFCLEVNPGGNTWHFSSNIERKPMIKGVRREDQLGAWEIAAKTLIERTRLLAT